MFRQSDCTHGTAYRKDQSYLKNQTSRPTQAERNPVNSVSWTLISDGTMAAMIHHGAPWHINMLSRQAELSCLPAEPKGCSSSTAVFDVPGCLMLNFVAFPSDLHVMQLSFFMIYKISYFIWYCLIKRSLHFMPQAEVPSRTSWCVSVKCSTGWKLAAACCLQRLPRPPASGRVDGRTGYTVHGLNVGGEPCVWCGGGSETYVSWEFQRSLSTGLTTCHTFCWYPLRGPEEHV